MNKMSLNAVPLDRGAVIRKSSVVTELNNQSLASVHIASNGLHEIKPLRGLTGIDKVSINTEVNATLVTGYKTIYENGTFEVVPASGGDGFSELFLKCSPSPTLQSKDVVMIVEGGTEVVEPDEGYDGLSKVVVNPNGEKPQYPYVGVELEGFGFISAPTGYTWGELLKNYPNAPVVNSIGTPYDAWEGRTIDKGLTGPGTYIVCRDASGKLAYVGDDLKPTSVLKNEKLTLAVYISGGIYYSIRDESEVSIEYGSYKTIQDLSDNSFSGAYQCVYGGFVFLTPVWPFMSKYGKVLKPEDKLELFDCFEKIPHTSKDIRLPEISVIASFKYPNGYTWKEYAGCTFFRLSTDGDNEYVDYKNGDIYYRLTTDAEGTQYVRHDDLISEPEMYYGWTIK